MESSSSSDEKTSPLLNTNPNPATSSSSTGAEESLEPVVAAVTSSKSKLMMPDAGSSMSLIKIKPGRELKLKCELNNTYGRIMWLLNGQPIRTDNGRYSIQGPSGNHAIEGRLTINNVLPEDNGIWQCHETKFDGKEHVSKPTRVIVL
ncbi:unnamed protein product, partial [Allacma fusca]